VVVAEGRAGGAAAVRAAAARGGCACCSHRGSDPAKQQPTTCTTCPTGCRLCPFIYKSSVEETLNNEYLLISCSQKLLWLAEPKAK
jgi:hypothetical protein